MNFEFKEIKISNIIDWIIHKLYSIDNWLYWKINRFFVIRHIMENSLFEPKVIYCGYYQTYKNNIFKIPLSNLDDIAVEGRVVFEELQHGWLSGGGKPYTSDVVEDPTWLEVALLANEMIHTTKDFHHKFLENIYEKPNTPHSNVKLMGFEMGS